MGDGELRVSYQLTKQDLFSFLTRHVLRRSRRTVTLPMAAVLAAIATVVVSKLRHPDLTLAAGLVLGLVAMGATILLLLLLLPCVAYCVLVASNNKVMLTPTTATASEAGLRGESPLWKAEYRWEAVIRVAEVGDLFCIFVATDAAVIIPRRAFADAAEFERFRSYVEERSGKGQA